MVRQGSENVGQNRSTSQLYQLFGDNEQTNEPRREKTRFCICENKDADQLRGNGEADQRLCFR